MDSSVLIAFLDELDVRHGDAREAMRTVLGRPIVPAIAYAEVLVGVSPASATIRAIVDRFFASSVSIEPLTEPIARLAARLRADHGIGIADAAIVATGLELDVRAILTADRRWRSIDERVVVIGRG